MDQCVDRPKQPTKSESGFRGEKVFEGEWAFARRGYEAILTSNYWSVKMKMVRTRGPEEWMSLGIQ